MNTLKHIIFDYGNVLLDIDLSLTMEALKKLNLQEFNPKDIYPDNRGIFLELELGKVTQDDLFAYLRSLSTQNPTDNELLDAWCKLLLPYDYSRFEMVAKLRKAGYSCHILSNTNKPHHDFFEPLFNRENPFNKDLKQMFDKVFYSDEMGLRKPDRPIYEMVQQELGNPEPGSILFIDDNLPNLTEPTNLGWNTIHLTAQMNLEDELRKTIQF